MTHLPEDWHWVHREGIGAGMSRCQTAVLATGHVRILRLCVAVCMTVWAGTSQYGCKRKDEPGKSVRLPVTRPATTSAEPVRHPPSARPSTASRPTSSKVLSYHDLGRFRVNLDNEGKRCLVARITVVMTREPPEPLSTVLRQKKNGYNMLDVIRLCLSLDGTVQLMRPVDPSLFQAALEESVRTALEQEGLRDIERVVVESVTIE